MNTILIGIRWIWSRMKWLFSLYFFKIFGEQATVHTVPSPSMRCNIKTLVITPEHTNDDRELPVLYLLHGYSSNYMGWLEFYTELQTWANSNQALVVCPDGDFDSWFIDSPIKTNRKFESFISTELVQFIDIEYKTICQPSGRAISGISMGGHGAIYNGIKHPDIFGAMGSSSGGLDLRPFPNEWGLKNILGKLSEKPEHWAAHSCINLLDNKVSKEQRYVIDCGTEDFFLTVNRQFVARLKELDLNYKYEETSGGHEINYWKNAMKKQLIFFGKYFSDHSKD